MKYIIAVVACAAEVFLYGLIGVFLGWKRGGGVIPMMILVAALGATWTGITNRDSRDLKPEEMD